MDNLLPQQNTLQKFVMQPKKEIKLFCERLIYFSTRQKRICVFTDSKKVLISESKNEKVSMQPNATVWKGLGEGAGGAACVEASLAYQ